MCVHRVRTKLKSTEKLIPAASPQPEILKIFSNEKLKKLLSNIILYGKLLGEGGIKNDVMHVSDSPELCSHGQCADWSWFSLRAEARKKRDDDRFKIKISKCHK